ncbi:hypothetical protein [Limosilactobacillus reuteri]|uniref:hypothetical protein n=1 Tax=Limosilactobacillus reuteri TaxID=1598 RepID=UPI00155AD476|nr:hypothetical protein [Limosilactobacillus reuteri]
MISSTSNSIPSLSIQKQFLENFVAEFNQDDYLSAKLNDANSVVELVLSYKDQETIVIPYSASRFSDCVKNPHADWPPVATQRKIVTILDRLFSIPLNKRV